MGRIRGSAMREKIRGWGAGDSEIGMGDGKETEFAGDELTRAVIGSIIRVHSTLGPGYVESIYRRSLLLDLTRTGLEVAEEREVDVFYLGERVGRHRLDLVVQDQVVLELKAVERLAAVHYGQLRSCLKASGLPVGLLVNFGSSRADYRRVNPL